MPEDAPEDLNRKDITQDIMLSDADIAGEDPAGKEAAAVEKGDHPVVSILDMAVKTGADYCRKENLPGPNNAVYENFSRPFLNTAMWHYLPDGTIPDDPRLALAVGVGGLLLAFTPTLLELHKRRSEESEEDAPAEPEKEEKRIKNPVTGTEYRVAEGTSKTRKEKREEYIPATDIATPKEGAEAPVWAGRLAAGRIPGL